MSGFSLADVLYRTADHVERFGHHKGEGYDTSGGVPWAVAPACAIGAISACSGPLPLAEKIAVYSAMTSFLGRGLVEFNDDPLTTQADVVAAFRAAAVQCEADAIVAGAESQRVAVFEVTR